MRGRRWTRMNADGRNAIEWTRSLLPVDGVIRAVPVPTHPRLHLRASAFICGSLLIAGCSGYAGPRSIVNEDPAVKIPEIKTAVGRRDRAAMPQLVKDLDSDDAAVRFYAVEALRRLTGETFGYDWTDDDRHARRPAIQRWESYVAANP